LKTLVDMNLPLAWVEFFLVRGIDAVHWSSVGSPGASDEMMLNHAALEGFTVCTSDIGFIDPLRINRGTAPSVVLLRSGLFMPAMIGTRVIAYLRATEEELNSGAVPMIDRSKGRVRLLPF